MPPESQRWRREAEEELRAAEVIAAHRDLPDRLAGFHAHLSAEKALKAQLIDRGVQVPRAHDLMILRSLLPVADQLRLDVGDLEILNPWTIDGRYPADIAEVQSEELLEVLAAARRVMRSVSPDL